MVKYCKIFRRGRTILIRIEKIYLEISRYDLSFLLNHLNPIEMKTTKQFSSAILLIVALFFQFSCNQSANEPSKNLQVRNTIKSVSLFQDSIGVDPIQLFTDLKMINNAVDSIGYPDAGYKLWEVISDDTLEFRFMVEGFWPDKKTYDLIHDNDLYKEAVSRGDAAWSSLKSTWYYRFNKIED